MGDMFLAYCVRHRTPATVAFYRARLKKFCCEFNGREFASLTPLEIDEHLAAAGSGMSDSTRHHDVVALQRLQQFALEHKLLDKPVFAKLEKPRVGTRKEHKTARKTGQPRRIPIGRKLGELLDQAIGTKICREKGIEFARRLLGHAHISTTQRYMHLDDRELADAQDLVE